MDGGERVRHVTDHSVPEGIRRARLDEEGARGRTPWPGRGSAWPAATAVIRWIRLDPVGPLGAGGAVKREQASDLWSMAAPRWWERAST